MFCYLGIAYYRGAMGILLVYDVTDESSFNNIRNWMRNIEQHASDNVNKVGTHLSNLSRTSKDFNGLRILHQGCARCPLVAGILTATLFAERCSKKVGLGASVGSCGKQM